MTVGTSLPKANEIRHLHASVHYGDGCVCDASVSDADAHDHNESGKRDRVLPLRGRLAVRHDHADGSATHVPVH